MNKALVIITALGLAGCASHSCDEPWSGTSCRADRLLYQNDLLQAKILIAAGQKTATSWLMPCSSAARRRMSAAKSSSIRRCC